MAWQEHIRVDPDVAFGKPIVAGTRIPVYMVLGLVEAGYTSPQIIADYYPTLTAEDVRACIRLVLRQALTQVHDLEGVLVVVNRSKFCIRRR